jgi:hypothetical protein
MGCVATLAQFRALRALVSAAAFVCHPSSPHRHRLAGSVFFFFGCWPPAACRFWFSFSGIA